VLIIANTKYLNFLPSQWYLIALQRAFCPYSYVYANGKSKIAFLDANGFQDFMM